MSDDYKKLVRPREGRMIAGVAAGFARYLNVDPILVRLLLIVLVFCAGAGAVLYIAGWILMPEEEEDEMQASSEPPMTY